MFSKLLLLRLQIDLSTKLIDYQNFEVVFFTKSILIRYLFSVVHPIPTETFEIGYKTSGVFHVKFYILSLLDKTLVKIAECQRHLVIIFPFHSFNI